MMAFITHWVIVATVWLWRLILGHKAALKMLNPQQQHSVFEQTLLQKRVFHHGSPWYMPAASAWYRARDWWDNWQRTKALKQGKQPLAIKKNLRR